MYRKFMSVFSDSDFWIRELSHEMRTPLYSILLLSEDLKKSEDLTDHAKKKVSQILRSADHLLGIVNSILDLTKIADGRCTLNEESFDLRQLMNDAVKLVDPTAKQRRIKVKILREGLKESYIGDGLKLRQVFINILSNAIRYSREKGKIRFIAKAIEKREEEDMIRFFIIDEGCGMDKAFIKKIFDPYSQEKERIGTSGLGLYITKSYVDLMKGRIFVSSRKGKGTAFILEIPLKKETSSKKPSPAEDLSLDGVRILIAEDVVINAKILENLLTNYGAKAELAENGKEALEMYMGSQEGHYDLLILDVRMPLLNGREVAKRIRTCTRKDHAIPIIALSGECSEAEKKESIDAGMDVHECKPVDPEKLLQTIRKLIFKNED